VTDRVRGWHPASPRPSRAHRHDDALNANIIRGELTEEPQPSGAVRMVSEEFVELPSEEIDAVISRARDLLA
jgi:hypothetical protein